MRFKVIKYLYFVMVIFILIRLGFWQIVMADELAARGENQRILTKEVVAPRGTIKFSDGSILASSQPTYLLYAEPKVINQKYPVNEEFKLNQEYKKDFSKKVANILWEDRIKYEIILSRGGKTATNEAELEAEKKEEEQKLEELEKGIFEKLNRDLYWISLGKSVSYKIKKRLEELELTGLGFDESSGRFYPEGSSSAHLLGFIGSDIYGFDTGYFGLEGFYNGELKGRRGVMTAEKDALGLPILIGKYDDTKPKEGKTLVLNIDRTVQNIAEEKLKSGVEKYGAKGGSVLVMDPSDGRILAMASLPSYDPEWAGYYPKENYSNPVTADSYEPGSTFKVLVMAAGITEKLIKPDTICDICAGPLKIADYTIRTWNNKYQENATMTDVIIHSDNTGMVFVGRKLGIDKMYEYLKKFGFGSLTGVDLQDEQSPSLRDKKEWREIDLATSSFGQGISVTPIQLVRAVAAIANGGKLFEPHVVSEIIDEHGIFKIKPRQLEQPISEDAANQVKEMMVQAVDKGEAQFYKKRAGIINFKIAGKTGTAQIPVAGHYDPTKTIASFVGFAPADDPRFVMLVRYVQPSSSIYGADTAAPTFFEIAKELFMYYGIPPSG